MSERPDNTYRETPDVCNSMFEPDTVAASPDLARRCLKAAHEAYLLHGTDMASATRIMHENFRSKDTRHNEPLMFGPGTYLAEASSKADEYATANAEGLYTMVVCRAVLGHSFVTEVPGDYRRKCEEEHYDSVVGDREAAVNTYGEFVFYKPEAIYPEYVVLYRRIRLPRVCPEPPLSKTRERRDMNRWFKRPGPNQASEWTSEYKRRHERWLERRRMEEQERKKDLGSKVHVHNHGPATVKNAMADGPYKGKMRVQYEDGTSYHVKVDDYSVGTSRSAPRASTAKGLRQPPHEETSSSCRMPPWDLSGGVTGGRKRSVVTLERRPMTG